MSMGAAHQAARGGRTARQINASIRRADALKGDGVLHNDDVLANQVYAEAINCPICHKRVHPSNFNDHMNNDHPDGKPLHEITERLPLAAIRTDGGTQPRAAINAETVSEYAEAMQDGATFPALVVYFDGREYWLADGYHRYHAANQCGLLDFPADVRQGTVRDAVLHSVGANATHGLRRTNQDKRRAVERLLRDDEWVKWSDREIARRCGVSDRFVNKLRAEIIPVTANRSQLEREYTTKHGTQATMAVGKIGRNPSLALPASGAGTGSSSPEDAPDGRVFVDVRPGTVTYGREVDDYVEDVADTYVDDVPSVEVDPSPTPSPSTGRGESSLLSGGLYEGAMVKAASGQVGQVVNLSGRIAIVETKNGQRPYDVAKLTLMASLPVDEEGTVPSFNYKRDAKVMLPADETISQPFDFCQTPAYALDPLLPYLGAREVWEPAAGEMGLVEALYDAGWYEEAVIASDILTGQNFLKWTPTRHFDVIMTNPPYSLKFPWMKRCYALGKPFALLLPVDVLGSKTAQALMQEHGFEMMLLDSRVNFKMPNAGWDGAGAQFATFWLTWQLLPEKIMFGSIAEGKKAWHVDHQ